MRVGYFWHYIPRVCGTACEDCMATFFLSYSLSFSQSTFKLSLQKSIDILQEVNFYPYIGYIYVIYRSSSFHACWLFLAYVHSAGLRHCGLATLRTAGSSGSFNYGDERVGSTSSRLKDFPRYPGVFHFPRGDTVSDADEVNNNVSIRRRRERKREEGSMGGLCVCG